MYIHSIRMHVDYVCMQTNKNTHVVLHTRWQLIAIHFPLSHDNRNLIKHVA